MQARVQARMQEANGIIFGFRAVGDWGCYSEGQGHMYYFGRTRQSILFDESIEGNEQLQKELLVKRLRLKGLNKPDMMLLWFRATVAPLDELWDRFKEHLHGFARPVQDEQGDEVDLPEIGQELAIGDNWYTCRNLGPADFGKWCKVVVSGEAYRLGTEIQQE